MATHVRHWRFLNSSAAPGQQLYTGATSKAVCGRIKGQPELGLLFVIYSESLNRVGSGQQVILTTIVYTIMQ